MNKKQDRMIKKKETRGTLDLPDIRCLQASVALSNSVFTIYCKTSDNTAALNQGFSNLYAQTHTLQPYCACKVPVAPLILPKAQDPLSAPWSSHLIPPKDQDTKSPSRAFSLCLGDFTAVCNSSSSMIF